MFTMMKWPLSESDTVFCSLMFFLESPHLHDEFIGAVWSLFAATLLVDSFFARRRRIFGLDIGVCYRPRLI